VAVAWSPDAVAAVVVRFVVVAVPLVVASVVAAPSVVVPVVGPDCSSGQGSSAGGSACRPGRFGKVRSASASPASRW